MRTIKHRLTAIARGIPTTIASQDRRFERQLQENREKEKRMLEFCERKVDRKIKKIISLLNSCN